MINHEEYAQLVRDIKNNTKYLLDFDLPSFKETPIKMNANIYNIAYASSLDDVEVEHSDKFEQLRDRLINHLKFQYLEEKLHWIQI